MNEVCYKRCMEKLENISDEELTTKLEEHGLLYKEGLVRVDVEYVQALLRDIRRINRLKFSDIEFYKGSRGSRLSY